jgi:hypothetical protein
MLKDRRKRNYIPKKSPLIYLPVSYNFTDLEQEGEDGEYGFSVGDDGRQSDNLIDKMDGSFTVLNVLHNLNDKEKIVFLIQLCREFGFEIDHGSYAKAIGIQRPYYMVILRQVRSKVKEMYGSI